MNIGYNRVQDPSRYGAIILAAGLSSRMNAFKPMLPVDGRPAVTGLTESLRGAGISDIIIVTGHQRELLQEEISRLRVAECYNENYADGMFTSIQAGFAKATEDFPEKRGWFLVPADCPLITIRTFKELMTAMDDAEKSAGPEDIRFYVPTYEGKKGHPLLVPAEMIPEILAHDGSGGLKAVTDRYPDQMIRVPVPDEEILLDMDTPEGYEDIRAFADRGFTREKLEVLSSRKRVFLVRHGQTRQHEEPVFIGQYDVPLSEEGLAQAKDIGREIAEAIADDVFAEKNYVEGVSLGREPLPAIERIYCSDLSRSVDSALLEASVTPNEGARSWAWTYGTDAVLPVNGTKGTVNAEVLAVAGDFFVFHQLAFRYGGGFLNDNSNPMGVVLDRDLAWRVYGAENIVGMTVTVNGEEYTIVGITDRESSSAAYKKAYGDTPRMYMSYRGYAKVAESGVSFFEAALPNSVRGFAMNIFSSAVRVNEDSSAVLEATDRFSLKNRYDNMKELAYAWVSINKIEFPYWENEARVCDYRAAVMMLFEVAFAAVAGTSLILSFILLRISGWTLTGSVKTLWKRLAEERERKRRDRPAKVRKTRRRSKIEQNPEKEV